MNNGAPNLDLSFHPIDFAALEQASRVAKIEMSEFCKLAIHVAARQTLAGAWPLGSCNGGTNSVSDGVQPAISPVERHAERHQMASDRIRRGADAWLAEPAGRKTATSSIDNLEPTCE